jgi:hypothetical protein
LTSQDLDQLSVSLHFACSSGPKITCLTAWHLSQQCAPASPSRHPPPPPPCARLQDPQKLFEVSIIVGKVRNKTSGQCGEAKLVYDPPTGASGLPAVGAGSRGLARRARPAAAHCHADR